MDARFSIDSAVSTVSALKRAIAAAGSQEELARLVGVTQPAISKWLSKGMVSGDYVLAVEKVSGVSRHELNPKLYPFEPAGGDHLEGFVG